MANAASTASQANGSSGEESAAPKAVRVRAATLAVGTELTDGQVIDRNSAWISQKLVKAGIEVIEHRAVADDRGDIERALADLSRRVDLLFVTGGLGPTSDDFTRDVLADYFQLPLEFDEESWKQVHEKLSARGLQVREIQRQQCFFPRSAQVLFNPAGTANAFAFRTEVEVRADSSAKRLLRVYALPGPPPEIASIWAHNLESEIEGLVPLQEREALFIYRCLGRAESEVAEKTEIAIQGSGIRVGYRAHIPYVEVKLWVPAARIEELAAVLKRVEDALGDWITNRDSEDVADQFLDLVVSARKPVRLLDGATGGWLQERILQRVRERKLAEQDLPLVIETSLALKAPSSMDRASELRIALRGEESTKSWFVSVKAGEGAESVLEVRPPYHYNFRAERARKFITEKALELLVTRLWPR